MDKARVLIVEDVSIAQKLARIILESLNCEVDIAANGMQAIELSQSKQYDLLLMDLGLPDVDGITVTENIRHINKHYEHVPIVALTAHADEDYRKNCIEIGMNDYLVKPFSADDAKRVLAQYVKPRTAV